MRASHRSLIAAACALAMLAPLDRTLAANRFFAESAPMEVGQTGALVLICCDNDEALRAFQVAIRFNPFVLQIRRVWVHDDAAIGGWSPPEESFSDYVDNATGQLFYGINFVVQGDGAEDRVLPPGINRELLLLQIDVVATAPTTALLDFTDDLTIREFARNAMVFGDGSTSYTAADGLGLVDALIPVRAAPPPPQLFASIVRTSDRFTGTLSQRNDSIWYAFDALEGTLLDIKLKRLAKSADSSDYELRLFRSGGVEVPIDPVTKPTSAQLKKAPLPATDMYFLSITQRGDGTGPFLAQLKGKPPKELLSVKDALAVSTSGEVVQSTFHAEPGSVLKAVVNGKKVDANILDLRAPSGASVLPDPSTGQFVPGPKSEKLVNVVLDELGLYTLDLTAIFDAGPAEVKVKAKVKTAKKRTIEDPSALPQVEVPFAPR